MVRQVTEGQPVTITARSRATGGILTDAPLSVEGDVYSDPGLTERHDSTTTGGDGSFTFYAQPGTRVVVTVDLDDAADIEEIEVVGTGLRPGGLQAQHTEGSDPTGRTDVSEAVTDSSLVGAPPYALPEEAGGAAAAVRAGGAQNVPPGAPSDVPTPDGTTATDPAAAATVATTGDHYENADATVGTAPAQPDDVGSTPPAQSLADRTDATGETATP